MFVNQNIFESLTAPEVQGWTDSVNILVKRFKNFTRQAKEYSELFFKYNLSLDGVDVNANSRRIDINLYDSSVFSIHAHPGSGWINNVVNKRHITWVGKPHTDFDPTKKGQIGELVRVYDLDFTKEEHFQLSTIDDVYDYDLCIKTLECCNELELKTGLIQIYPHFFHSEVQCMLDAILYGYDK